MKATTLAAALFLAAGAAHADDRTMAIYGDIGRAAHGQKGATDLAAVGVMLPWTTFEATRAGPWSSYLDVFASAWQAPRLDDGHGNYLQIGAMAMGRYRFDGGNSPWFAEGGVGVTLMNHVFRTPDRQFSTAFQFTEALGVGRSFGQRGEHEVSLRVQHFSNAGIKEPNPGETFLKLRYAYRF